jgi:hypothetical protein
MCGIVHRMKRASFKEKRILRFMFCNCGAVGSVEQQNTFLLSLLCTARFQGHGAISVASRERNP